MIRINLLPFRAARKKENIRRQISIAVLMIIFTVLFITYLQITITQKIEDRKDQIADLKKQIASLQVSVDQVNQFKKKKRELEAKLEVINKLESNRKGPLTLLVKMSEVIPDRAWLTKFNQSGTSIKLEGIALDNETISLFLSAMEKDPRFTNVELGGSQIIVKDGKPFQKFKISCRENPKAKSK